ncbi:MAG TPA: Clp protease N-terminal domain-containing protein [Nocardioides sp.]|uniref:Clp protease N-terminal domain-containing protein n=1 Tax=Nocardioides sp. TaxID=35761 RepID=UPI002F3FA98A
MSPKINVYLPDDLAGEVKASGIPVSAVCQQALADAVARAGTGRSAPLPPNPGEDLSRNFTKRAYGVLSDADKAAEAAGEKPTTVDLMAAIVDSNGLAVTVLSAADIVPEDAVDELRGRARSGGSAEPLETVAERAVEQARGLGHSYVGTEHLLLAITAGSRNELAAKTLRDMGMTHERALQGVVTALSAYEYARETLTFSGISAPIRAALEDIRSRLARLEDRPVSGP